MIEVLQLVTNENATFFRQQVEGLERLGVSCTVVSVPGGADGRRSLTEYAKFYGSVLRRIPDSVDLVHANYGLTAPAALAQPHRPIVLTLWGSDLMGEFADLSQWCGRRVDEVIVMSQAMADRFDGESHVIPHGVDLDRFRPTEQALARAELKWPADRPTVLFPYDPDRAVKNFDLASRVTDAADRHLADDVALEVVSGIPHDRVPTYMNAADVLLLTSEWEGSPNVVKEALACDLPVVATDVGDVRERLDGLAYSTVADESSALVDAVVDVLRARPVREGRDSVSALTVDAVTRDIADVYATALGRNRLEDSAVI